MKIFISGGIEGDPATAATALDAGEDMSMEDVDSCADASAVASFSKLAALAGRRTGGRQSTVGREMVSVGSGW
jgi:hypothetical protein